MIRLVEMKSNVRTKKRHSKNQSPISLEAVLAIKTMKEPESDLKEKESHSILKKKKIFLQEQIYQFSHQQY